MTTERNVDCSRLEGVLRATGAAHHAAYVATDGDDPEWPFWYAQHVIDEMRSILHRPDLTVSRLVWAFVACDDAFSTEQPGTPWYRFYADRLIEDLSRHR